MVISLSAVIIAIIICLTTILLYWVSLKKKLKNVLFIGICDSGKTTLFSSIVYGSPSTTFTSLNENVANLQVNKKALVLVDVPGHEKVRNEIIQKYKVDTLALIFVIDSKTVQSDIKDIAELVCLPLKIMNIFFVDFYTMCLLTKTLLRTVQNYL
ncbi:unnamed protein product [Heterobilharzia americana]|nr:unnamed protein product [Heterobilharzia americana]